MLSGRMNSSATAGRTPKNQKTFQRASSPCQRRTKMESERDSFTGYNSLVTPYFRPLASSTMRRAGAPFSCSPAAETLLEGHRLSELPSFYLLRIVRAGRATQPECGALSIPKMRLSQCKVPSLGAQPRVVPHSYSGTRSVVTKEPSPGAASLSKSASFGCGPFVSQ